jgi:hypothetical protein
VQKHNPPKGLENFEKIKFLDRCSLESIDLSALWELTKLVSNKVFYFNVGTSGQGSFSTFHLTDMDIIMTNVKHCNSSF